MNRILLALAALLLPVAGWAAQVTQCNFYQSTSGYYTGIPTDFTYRNRVVIVTASTVVTTSIPVVTNPSGGYKTIIECPSSAANFSICHATGTYNDCGNISTTTTVTNGTGPDFNATCRQLLPVSGTLPTTTYLYNSSANQAIYLNYCYK